jgi:16S rRNA (cytosine1402-N4)-methyltransferase
MNTDTARTSRFDGSTAQGDLPDFASIHTPVMLAEVLAALLPERDEQGASRPLRFLDGTLGLAGHASALLEQADARGLKAELLGLDRDAAAQSLAAKRLEPFGGAARLRQSAFADFPAALDELGWDLLDGALLDLGVSSLQLDSPERGFSFLHDGPLDMRMDPQSGAESASALVNRAPVARLKEIIEQYGEEPQAGRIARAIDDARAERPIGSTAELAAIVERAYPPKWRATARNHPATRTFQALRLAVNDELGQLRLFLERIVPRLRPGGRLAVISFHSLEDRLVKHFFRTAASGCLCPPHLAVTMEQCRCGHQASLRLVTRKALEPSEAEARRNGRARSARLRVAERIAGAFSLPALSEDLFADAGDFAAAKGRGRRDAYGRGRKGGPGSGRAGGSAGAGGGWR